MAKKLDDIMAALPKERRQRINARTMELATLKDLRQAAQQTQEQLAATLGVGQDTISRLEKRSDMLLSTLRHYVESMGGQLNLVAQFPNRPPVVIQHLGVEQPITRKKIALPSGEFVHLLDYILTESSLVFLYTDLYKIERIFYSCVIFFMD
jgi:transcriptional regulator with XRE-family HTH domain